MGKTQTICLFASHAFWSHNLEMQKHEITPDTTRVQTCSLTNTKLVGNLERFNWLHSPLNPFEPIRDLNNCVCKAHFIEKVFHLST